MTKSKAASSSTLNLNADISADKQFPAIALSETLTLWTAALTANGGQPLTIVEALKSAEEDERALRRHTVNSLSLIGSRQLLADGQHRGKTAYRIGR